MEPITRSQTTRSTIITTIIPKTVTEPKENQKLFIHPMRHVEKQTAPQRVVPWEPMQPIVLLPPWHRRPEGQKQVQERANQSVSNEKVQAAAQKLN